ncbi:GNAT family N-acetyltransferase, partial [Klebsiella pneumoniae]|uniref:GNAT family N-acetyltransferase n=1 Tax=Klebsiella pneumoniae TaxID=573 RepID=UPI0021F498C0
MHIINAEEQHIPAIRRIYAHHVLHGTGSFETEPPDTQEMLARVKNVQSRGFPWYIALQGETVIGYCYLSRYRERHAYRFTVENSVYIDPAGTVAKLAMRQPFVLFKGLTFQKLCLPGA